MTPTEKVLNQLKNVVEDSNGWKATCPAHDDKIPSLSISEGTDGKVLLKCFAGCEVEAIVHALGLEMSGLFPGQQKVGETVYDYSAADGKLIFQVVREEPKRIYARRPNKRNPNKYVNDLTGVDRILYRLPELSRADPTEPVFVVEGEKCVHAAESIGLLATTSPCGSNAAHKADWSPLAGRTVYVIPDNDKSGRKYARTVAEVLKEQTPGSVVKVLNSFPTLPEIIGPGDDLADWVERLDGKEPSELKTALLELAESEPELTKSTHSKPKSAKYRLQSFEEIESRELQWLWPGWIPLGKFSLVFGDPSVGKSFLTLDFAARLSIGKVWPDGAENLIGCGDTIILSTEDDPGDTIKPRLKKLGANLNRIHFLACDRNEDFAPFSLHNGLDELAELLAEHPSVRLVILDPISAYCGKVDSHKNTEVRGMLAPLTNLASQFDVAVVGITHNRKSGNGKAVHGAMGSVAFTATARSAWLVCQDPDQPTRRLFLPAKNNLSKERAGMAFGIVDGGLVWEPDPVSHSANDILAREDQQKRPSQSVVEQWLVDQLSNGPKPASAISESAENAGFSEKKLRTAREKLCKTTREGYGQEGGWFWELKPEYMPIGARTTDRAS